MPVVNRRALFPPRHGAIGQNGPTEAVSMYERPMDFTPPPGQFELEQEGGDFEHPPWGPEHPLWIQFKRGECKIVRAPDGHDYLVPKEAYAERTKDDTIPLEVFANASAQAIRDQPASLAQIRYQYGKSLCAFACADVPPPVSAGNHNPLIVPPVQPGGAGNPLVGGCVLVASLDFGFQGAQSKYQFDLPPGLTIKAPFAGNFGRLTARLMPKYYPPVVALSVQSYLQTTGGLPLTSELFNADSSAIIAGNPIDTADPAPCRGWFSLSEGTSNDTSGKPTRRFYGSVLTTGAAGGQPTLCPVAMGAMWVMLVGGRFVPGFPARGNVLSFLQNGPPSVNGAANGPFPSNVMVPLIDNVQSITVLETSTGDGALNVPFELLYWLSF